jgi:uridine kinase
MKPLIIAINAVSGGGKTTITRELHKRWPNSAALYFDDRNYDSDSGIEDTCDWVEAGADVNLFNLERLAADIEKIRRENIDFIFLDYPFGYRHRLIAPYVNYSIFIDASLDVAMARRILRDFTVDSAAEILDDMKQYLDRGRNAYLFGLDSIRKEADFIVDGNMPVKEIIEKISGKILEIKSTVMNYGLFQHT